jgi:membrane associated rhomboid family serine protease
MRSASVGQQCVECVQQGQRGVRQPRNQLAGGFLRGNALVTKALVAINILLFLVELAKPSLGTDWAMLGYAYYYPGGALHGVAAGEWYRLITSAFLPPAVTGGGLGLLGLLDIAFNMYALIIVGPAIEQVLGRWRFTGVYLLSALGGSVMYYYVAPQNVLALGASGAIFGLFGAWFVMARRMGADSRGITMLIGFNLVISFAFRGTIAWQAHVGGLLTGLLVTAAYVYAPRKNRTVLQVAATVVILAVAIVAVMLRTHQLHEQLQQLLQ